MGGVEGGFWSPKKGGEKVVVEGGESGGEKYKDFFPLYWDSFKCQEMRDQGRYLLMSKRNGGWNNERMIIEVCCCCWWWWWWWWWWCFCFCSYWSVGRWKIRGDIC